jgi:hypothetical protein
MDFYTWDICRSHDEVDKDSRLAGRSTLSSVSGQTPYGGFLMRDLRLPSLAKCLLTMATHSWFSSSTFMCGWQQMKWKSLYWYIIHSHWYNSYRHSVDLGNWGLFDYSAAELRTLAPPKGSTCMLRTHPITSSSSSCYAAIWSVTQTVRPHNTSRDADCLKDQQPRIYWKLSCIYLHYHITFAD